MTTVNQVPFSWRAGSAAMRAARHLMFGAILIGTSAFLSACGGCGPEEPVEDLCEGKTCDRGLCEKATGMCINSVACDGDDTRCLDGYECQVDGVCEATIPCSDTETCARGECVSGACINADTCTSNAACVEGSICQGGMCVTDLCAGKTCERGVCARATGECVNAITCTEQNEATECIEDFKCDAQECVDESTYCQRLACARGVCSFDAKECTDATDCGGEDSKCLAGNFCNDANTCMANVCLADSSACMGGGECVAATGECINPESCDARSDCLPMNLCVAGACVPQAEACGVEGCKGNQECFYNEAGLEAVCQESAEGCSNALDCTDNRICDGGSCAPGLPCQDDANEPNDAQGEATSYADAQVLGAVRANVCGGDVDLYTFDTQSDPDDTGSGVMLVNLDYNASDVGLGSLKVELLSPAGAVVESAVADANGKVRLTRTIGLVARGVYTIRVSDEGNVLSSGIFYSLYVDIVDRTASVACMSAPLLAADTQEMSTTISGESTALRSTCADRSGAAPEDIYRVDVTERSYLTIIASAAPTADVSLSLRSECLSDNSEVPGACADRNELGGMETINALVEPGTYFIVVQGADAMKGGSYTLSWSRSDVTCTSANDSCLDGDTANRCISDGSGFTTDECGVPGCNATTGRCNRPAGDRCDSTTPTITKAMSPFVSAPFTWSDLASDYNPGSTGCVATTAGAVATDGPDISFRVVVPANHGLNVNLLPGAMPARDVSLYLVRDCLALDQCEVGANLGAVGAAENLIWFNSEATDQAVYVIADSGQLAMPAAGTATLRVEISEVICAVGSPSCEIDPATGSLASGICNTLGTSYGDFTACSFGCDMSTGLCNPPTNDTCASPVALTAGVSVQGTIEQYANNHNVGTECTTRPSTGGGDATYSIDLVAGDIVNAVANSTFDSVIWASTGCDTTTPQLTGCVSASDTPEEINFVAPADGTYYITVAAYFGTGRGTFDLLVDVQKPNCTPGQPRQCDATGTTVEYCSVRGILQTYTCAGNSVCTNGVCDQPTGDVCIDAIPIVSGVPAPGSISSFTNNHNVGPACSSLPFTGGKDVTYSIELVAGDIVDAAANSTFNSVIWASGACDESEAIPSCLSASDTPEEIGFVAPTDGTYYITVAASSSTGTGTYNLTVDVQKPNCVIGQPAQCDATGGAIEYCNSRGLLETYACAGNNVCTNGACEQPSGNVCIDAIPIVSGVPAPGTIDTFTNNHNVGTACTTRPSTSGKDVTYSIDLVAGDIVDAVANSTFDSVIWASGACGGAEAMPACVTASDTPERISFIAPSDGTYYITVAAWSSTGTGTYNLTVNVQKPNCVIGQPAQCDATGGAVEFCDARGVLQSYTCASNSPCMNGTCDLAGNVCTGAIPITRGVPAPGTIDTFTGNHSVGSACTSSPSTNGKDVTYSIDLLAGDIVDAVANSTFDSVIWASSACDGSDVMPACVTASDTPERINFVAPTDGTYYITVAAWSATGTGTYNLTVDVQTPNCTPGDPAFCEANGMDLTYCSALGVYNTFMCGGNGLCSGDACEDPSGDVCFDTIKVNPTGAPGMFSFMGDLSLQTNGSDLTAANGCTTFDDADGNDVIYEVIIPDGATLTATQTIAGGDAALYVLEICGDNGLSCIVGADDTFSGSPETVSYTHNDPTGQGLPLTVFVVADVYAQSAFATDFTIVINVQ